MILALPLCLLPRYWLATTEPPVAIAVNMLINSAITNSTRLIALTALSLTLAAISEFASPKLYSKNCSTAIGKNSFARSVFEKNFVF